MKAKFNLAPDTRRWIYVSSTPVPAPLHTCREARTHLTENVGSLGYYKKAFYQVKAVFGFGKEEIPLQPGLRLELGLGPEPRFVWVNFEMDIISIGQATFDLLEPYYHDIKRLKFARECDEYFARWECEDLRKFPNVREVHVVCLDTYLDAWEGAEEYGGLYGVENILLIHAETGEMMTNLELNAKRDEIRAVNYRKQGARINFDTQAPFVPWLPPGWFEGQEEWDDYYGDW